MKHLAAALYAAGTVVLFACVFVYAVMDHRQIADRQAQILMASGLPPIVAFCVGK